MHGVGYGVARRGKRRRPMLTLIKREIEDNYVFFVGTLILTVILTSVFVWGLYYGEKDDGPFIGVPVWNSFLGMLIFCGMGAAQMYWDRTKKISALLATLAVSRGRIFIARVIAGFLLVIIGLFPLAAVTVTAVLTRTADVSHSVRLLYPDVSIPVFVLGFACYCIGLQAGWTSNRITPTLGAIVMSIILITVILIKGFGWEIYVILAVFITACLVRAWYKFSRAAF
jgi:ABC-type transport system involved in multi-copper enzyme maturation permease subunit